MLILSLWGSPMNVKAVIQINTNNLLRYGYEDFIINPLTEIIVETTKAIGKKTFSQEILNENGFIEFHRWDGTQFYLTSETI